MPPGLVLKVDNSPETSRPTAGPTDKPKPVRRPRVTERDPVTNRFVKREDTAERRRLSVEMKARGASWSMVANAHWGGDRGTAMQQVKKWYADNPSEDVLTTRRLVADSLENLETIVRGVMERQHYLVDKGRIVLDLEGEPLLDDKPIYEGVDRILKLKEALLKITPGLAAPKVVAEITNDELLAQARQLRAELERERAELSTIDDGVEDEE